MSLFGNLSRAASIFSEGIVTQAEEFAKAAKIPTGGPEIEASGEDPEGLIWDPFSIIEQLGWKDKPSAMTYGTLRTMVWRTPLIQDIILTRLGQMAAFTRRQQDKLETGFRVAPEDKTYKMTSADKALARRIEDMFETTGVVRDNVLERCNFDTFTRAFMRDSLTFDQGCAEITKNRKKQPAAWYASDASSIRLADTSSTSYTLDPDRIHTVQIYDNMVINQWTKDRMMFCVRNPHTDIRLYGYGVSELEMLINAVTAILWAFEYNQRFFSQGSVAKGILNIKGTMNQRQLRAFRRHWYQMISGVENAWRSPVLNSAEGAEWIDMHPSNRDMEFSNWMDFLIKLIANCYQMDPMEVGFKYGDSGQAGGRSMFESGNKEKLTASKDKGLRPLLQWYAAELTRYIVAQIEPGFTFEFVGLERETKKELAELNQILVKSTKTVNELREKDGDDPIPEGDIILDPTYVQHLNNLEQQKLQKTQMSQQDDQTNEDRLQGSLEGDLDRQSKEKQASEKGKKDENEFGEDDFAQLMDRNSGTKPPQFGKSLRKSENRSVKIELEV